MIVGTEWRALLCVFAMTWPLESKDEALEKWEHRTKHFFISAWWKCPPRIHNYISQALHHGKCWLMGNEQLRCSCRHGRIRGTSLLASCCRPCLKHNRTECYKYVRTNRLMMSEYPIPTLELLSTEMSHQPFPTARTPSGLSCLDDRASSQVLSDPVSIPGLVKLMIANFISE